MFIELELPNKYICLNTNQIAQVNPTGEYDTSPAAIELIDGSTLVTTNSFRDVINMLTISETNCLLDDGFEKLEKGLERIAKAIEDK